MCNYLSIIIVLCLSTINAEWTNNQFNNCKVSAMRNNVNEVQRCVTAENINVVGPQCGRTILMIATGEGSMEVAAQLLEMGADPNQRQLRNAVTPMMAAADRGNMALYKLFLKYKGNPAQKDANGKNSNDHSIEHGFGQIPAV